MKKTIKEIVEELRASGELDEEKLKKLEKGFNKKKRIFYSISAFLVAIAIIKMEPVGIIFTGAIAYYLILVALKNSSRELEILTYLFCFGKKDKAIVLSSIALCPFGVRISLDNDDAVNKLSWSGSLAAILKIKSGLNLNKIEITNTYEVPLKWIEKEECPKTGAEIDIIYDQDNPSLFRFYNEKLNDFYCINKNKKEKCNGS